MGFFDNSGWGEGFLATLEAYNHNAGIDAVTRMNSATGAATGVPYADINNIGAMMWGAGDSPGFIPGLQDTIQGYGRKIPGMFDMGTYLDNGQWNSGLGGMLGTTDTTNALRDTANQLFQGGGWTPQYQHGFDSVGGWMDGNLPQSGNVNNLSNSLLNQFGQTAFTQNAADRGGQGMNAGMQNYSDLLAAITKPNVLNEVLQKHGENQFTGRLYGAGDAALTNNLGVEGLTGTGAQGEQAALNILNAGGVTPTTQGLQGFGVKQATQNPLMTPEQAMSLAQGRSADQIQAAATAAQAKALARGGGPGAVVANGGANQALADFQGQAAQTMDASVQQALEQQQQLGLSEQGQAAQMALGGGNLQRGFLDTGGSILGNLESTANQRLSAGGGLIGQGGSMANQLYLGGMNLIPELEQQATNQANVFGNLGISAGQMENARMSLGLQGANMLQQNTLGAGQLYNNIMGNQNQYALGGGSLANNATATQGNIMNEYLGQQLGMGGLGLNYAAGQNNAMNSWQQNMLGLGGLYNQNMTTAENPLTAIATNSMDLYRQYLANLPGFAGPAASLATYSPGMQLIGSLAQAAGAAAGAYAKKSSKNSKKNIERVGPATPVTGLQPVAFHYREQENTEPKHVGFIAEEVLPHYPETVLHTTGGEVWGLDYAALNERITAEYANA